MYLTKKHLPRRTFLRGLGATVSLPLLDAMLPAATAWANTGIGKSPNFGFIYFPHGAVMDKWTPTSAGAEFDLPPILAPLAQFKDQMTIVSGLRNKTAEGGAVHTINPGTWLSCTAPAVGGVSADQIVAQHVGRDTPFPSLELCVEVKAGESSCPDYGCGYGSTISFRTPTQPLPMEHNPRKLFHRLFGQGDNQAEREAIVAHTGSLLDLVADSAASLQGRLGPSDRMVMSEYLDSVREIEQQVQKLSSRDFSELDLPEAPAGIPPNFEEHINVMFDLTTLAFRTNLTHVVSFMMAAEVSMLTYNQIGVSDAFHPLSHHQNNPAKLERLAKVQTYHSKVFARFLEQLRNTSDGDGSLLDHSILLYGSNMSNANLHDANPLPSALFGHGYGRIKGGQHIVCPPDTPLANLLLTVLERGQIPVESLGNSTGLITQV